MAYAETAHKPHVSASVRLRSGARTPIMTIDNFIVWIGSIPSLIAHTVVFAAFFVAALIRLVAWDQMLLVLTTLLSLEAIYLAIFIQMSVNRQAASLKEVEADVDAIQENVEDLKEDVGDIQQDMVEITEDADEEKRKLRQAQMLETLTNDVKMMLRHIESLKAR